MPPKKDFAEDRLQRYNGQLSDLKHHIWSDTIHRTASSIHSRVHSLSVCDSILANISQRLSACDTRMRSLALTGSISLASVTQLLSAGSFSSKRSSFLCSPAMFRLAVVIFFQFVLVLSLRGYLFFQVEMKEPFFHFQILWSVLQLQESCTWQIHRFLKGKRKNST